MFNYLRKAGTTDVSVVIRIIDSTDGTPETGVVYNTAGIDLEYRREGATSTDITEATLAGLDSAHSDGGFLHIGNGYYRLDLPDAACTAGVAGVLVHGTVTGMVVIGCYIQLVTFDPFDSVRMGMTALPNAAADAAGGLPISDAGGLDLDAKLANTNEVTAARMGALTDWINGGRLDLILDIIAADTTTDIPATLATMDGKLDTIDNFLDTEVAAILEDTGTTLPATLTTIEGKIDTIDGIVDNILVDTGTTLDGKIDTIDGIVDAILVDTAVIGAAGAGLTAIPWNASWDAEVQSECTDALNAYDPPTKAELDTAVANVSVDEIQATALADLFNTDSGTTYAAAIAGSVVKEIADNAGGSALTEGGIADAVWDEALAGHLGAGSTGAALNAAGSAGDPWSTLIPGAYGAGTAGKILGDNINATVSSRASQTSVDTIDDFIDTEIAGIVSTLGAAGAGLTAVPWNAAWDAEVQSEAADAITAASLPTAAQIKTAIEAAGGHLALILEDTGTTLDALIKDIPTVAEFEARTLVAASYFDPATDEVDADVVKISGSTDAADKLEASAETIETGAAAAGTLSTTEMTTDLTEATNDHYNGRIIIWTSGVLLRQATDITDYDGATKKLTYTAVTEAPTAGDTFIIV